MRKKLFGIITIMIISILPGSVSAKYNPSWDWKTIQTEHFTIYYPKGHEAFAQRVLLLSDEVYKDVTQYLNVKPPKCPVVLNPGTDIFNGFYAPLPNRISLFETPASHLRGFGPGSDIIDHVFTHEFTHFVHITTTAGWYHHLSTILGKGSAISNILSPSWIIEGITTNTETMFTDGGRGRCSYFKGQMMSCTEDEGLWNLSAAGVYSPYRPPGNRFYLAGYHMVEYLNENYGKDAFARLSLYQAKHPIGGTAKALKQVTKIKPSQFYKDFLEDFQKKTNQLKKEALNSGLPQGTTIVSEKYENLKSHFWTRNNTIIAIRTGYDKKSAFVEVNPLTGAVINEFKTGRINALMPVRSLNNHEEIVFAGFYPHPLSNEELSSTDITFFNTKTKKFRRITKNMHIYSADISPDNTRFIAARRNGMWIDLVIMDKNGKNLKTLISKPGYYFEAPEWAPDSKKIISVVKSGQNADIALIQADSGDMELLFNTDVHEDNEPSFSPDSQWIVFSSNRQGIWNIFAWNIKKKELFQLTSVFYGASEPKISPDGKALSFLSLHRGINKLCTMAFKPEKGKKIIVGKSTDIKKPDLTRVEPEINFIPKDFPVLEAYTPFLHIPYIESEEDSFTLGLWLTGADPVGINSYSASFFHKSVSDISNTAGTSDEEEDKGYFAYDISLTNNSFWPSLQIRFYEDILNGGILWYRERMAEFSTQFSIINRIIPDRINTSIIAGGRYRHQTSLNKNIHFDNTKNDSSSLFSEISISRFPDYAKRDIIPGCGQLVFGSYEESIKNSGGESNSHNIVISLKQYLPSFFKHHGFKLTGVHQEQKGLSYSKDLSLPRGYSKSENKGGLNLDKNILLSGEYHFPIAYPDIGPGLSCFHINAFKSSFFFDLGAGWENSFDKKELLKIARQSIGASLTCKASILSLLAIETGVEGGYKIKDKEGFVNFVLILGF